MTVQKLYAKNIYKGNGSNKSFPFTFECPENHPEFVRVFVRENYLNETTNFAIDMQNRIVTYPVDGDALPEGANIIITRELPLTQVMNLINNGPFFAEDIETSLDEIVMMIQQLNEKADRSLTVEVDSTENPNDVIGRIFDARTLTQKLAEESAAAAAASLQSEQNAKASENASAQNKTATEQNKASVERSEAQVNTLLTQVVLHEKTALTYSNNAAASAIRAGEYEESSGANAITASNAASYAGTKASEADTSEKNAAASVATVEELTRLVEQYKNLAYQYMQGSVNIPVGTPLLWFWGEDTIPVGFIRYTTSSLSATTYPDLFGLVGHKYGGSGDEFYLPPDLYGRFMEISDVAGVYHEAGLPNIEGSIGMSAGRDFINGQGALIVGGGVSDNRNVTGNVTSGDGSFSFNASLYNEIYGNSDTVQPKSITAILIIKAFAGASPKATDLEITNVANDVVSLSGRVNTIDSKVENVGATIVDSGTSTDGLLWYRKWSDGWLEQGGIVYATAKTSSQIITMPMHFADKDKYTVVTNTIYSAGPSGNAYLGVEYSNGANTMPQRTTNSFTMVYTISREFYACGMGAND